MSRHWNEYTTGVPLLRQKPWPGPLCLLASTARRQTPGTPTAPVGTRDATPPRKRIDP